MKYFVILLTAFISYNSRADIGCLVGNTVYTNLAGYTTVSIIPSLTLGDRVFYNNSSLPATEACPGWAFLNYSTGNNCTYGSPTLGITLGGFQIATCLGCPTGTEVDYTYVNCNLDHYTYLMGLSIGAFGLMVIRKQRKR